MYLYLQDPTIPTMKEQFTALHLAARCKIDFNGEESSDEEVDYVDVPPSRSIVHFLVALPEVKVSYSAINGLMHY